MTKVTNVTNEAGSETGPIHRTVTASDLADYLEVLTADLRAGVVSDCELRLSVLDRRCMVADEWTYDSYPTEVVYD